MRIQFASLSIDLAYGKDKSVVIRRFPTKYETEKLKKPKYKLVDEEIYASDNQIELSLFYNTTRKFVRTISGGNFDFTSGGRYGIDIDLRMRRPEGELNKYLCSVIRQLCKKHLEPCILFSSRYTIDCQIDSCRLTNETVKNFLEDFITSIESRMEEFKVVKKEEKIEEKAEEQVRKIEEQEKCSDCGKELKFLTIEHWYDDKSDKVINVCSDCKNIRVEKKAEKQIKDIVDKAKEESKKTEDKEENHDDKSEKIEKKYERVGGWLLLFVLSLLFFMPAFTIYNIVTGLQTAFYYNLFNLYPKFLILCIIDFIISMSLLAFAIYTAFVLIKIRENAASIAKKFLIVYFVYGVLIGFGLYFVDFPSDVYFTGQIGSNIFRSLIYCGIWYYYLSDSKRVKMTYSFENIQDKHSKSSEENIGTVNKKWKIILIILVIIACISASLMIGSLLGVF